MNNSKTSLVTLAACSLLAACGGGGGDEPAGQQPQQPAAASAEGLYSGSTGNGRAMTGLVLNDGSYYFLYSSAGNADAIAGVVQGTGVSTASAFSSANARDFNLEGLGVLPATVSATYAAKQSISGTLNYGSAGSTTFTGSYDTQYDVTPSLAAMAGTFSGQVASSAGGENATVTVSAAGAISGAGASGCQVSGTATPRARGNAFNVSLVFGGAPCLFANQTLAGIAYFDADSRMLYAAAPNQARTDGVLFVGTRP